MAKSKKLSTKIAAIALAAAVVVGGGTFAYLQDSSDAEINQFNPNTVTVDISETSGNVYEVIPGKTVTKDPTVTVNATVPAWVFVTVEDDAQDIVSWAIADGWSVLYGEKDDSFILYREVEGKDEPQKFSVISGDSITFPASLENKDMQWTDLSKSMTFQAYAIQKEGFPTAKEAWEQFANGMAVSETISKDENTILKSPATVAMNGENTTVEFPKEIVEFNAADGMTAELEVEATRLLPANAVSAFNIVDDRGSVGAIDLTVKVNGSVVTEFKDADGEKVPVTVTTYIAKGLTLNNVEDTVALKYVGTGDEPTLVSYDTDTGKLVFTTTHFSTFAIGADQTAYIERVNTAYLTIKDAVEAAAADDEIILIKNPTENAITTIDKNLTLNMNGKTVYNDLAGGRIFTVTAGTFNVDGHNGKFEVKNEGTYGFFRVDAANNATLNIKDASMNGNTDNGAFIKVFTVAGGKTFTLNVTNVTGTTNSRIQDINFPYGKVIMNFTDCTFTSGLGTFTNDGLDATNIATFNNVTATSEVGPIIEVAGTQAVFNDCNFRITKLKDSPNEYYSTTIGLSYEAVATVNGGTYVSDNWNGIEIYTTGGTFNINDGTFTGANSAVYTHAESDACAVNVYGGTFNGALTLPTATTTTKIYGGSFTADPTAFLAEGHTAAQNDSVWVVK